MVQEVVLEKANKIRLDELQAILKSQAAEIINALAKAIN